MVPVEIDHIVSFEIERLIPKAFDKIVVDKPLNVVCADWDAEKWHGLGQSDLRAKSAELASQFSVGGGNPRSQEERIQPP
jgi:hypothetical protein